MKTKNLDVLVAVNLVLFVAACFFVYYHRFIQYVGRENIHEFFIYAVVIIAAIIAAGAHFRKFDHPTWLLVLIEVGLLMHFAGGMVHFDGARLYDHRFIGIRFDKYVHLVNAFVAAYAVLHLFEVFQLKLSKFKYPVAVFVVLGLGTLIEIIEYAVTKTVKNNGVGGYDNNMLDLVANMCGGIAAAVSHSLLATSYNDDPVTVENDLLT